MISTMHPDCETRCAWCGTDPLYSDYHDHEWGVPVFDDDRLFEMLILEGAQAGLSWLTILKKRENYRNAFTGFDPLIVAAFTPLDVERLLQDSGIVRNRLKIEAAIKNARAVLDIQKEYGSLAAFIWSFVDGIPRQNHWSSISEVPTSSPQSNALSKALKQRGCNFVGATICYALMQATGMVNDHTLDCFRHQQIKQMGDNMPTGIS
ncbi:MAG TPA: DNA-3-methyladenine glycosylase I [Pelovirga sp.]|nr:DNA-3-methyladenine glycosylase I [Pelovirga sp.]